MGDGSQSAFYVKKVLPQQLGSSPAGDIPGLEGQCHLPSSPWQSSIFGPFEETWYLLGCRPSLGVFVCLFFLGGGLLCF